MTKKEKAFCKLYIKLKSRNEAAEILGYEIDINKSRCVKYIKKNSNVEDEFTISKASILKRHYAIVEFDPITMYDKDGDVLLPEQLLPEQRLALRTYREVKPGVYEFSVYDKKTSLEALTKHLGLYEKDNHQKAELPTPLDFNACYDTFNQ